METRSVPELNVRTETLRNFDDHREFESGSWNFERRNKLNDICD